MKVFYRKGVLNIIDDNNVLVGFDYDTHCCESYGADIVNDVQDFQEVCDVENSGSLLDDYSFDTTYYEEGLYHYGEEKEDRNAAFFKLVHKDKPDLFLVLYNWHNGYYAHGFEALNDGKLWVRGYI